MREDKNWKIKAQGLDEMERIMDSVDNMALLIEANQVMPFLDFLAYLSRDSNLNVVFTSLKFISKFWVF